MWIGEDVSCRRLELDIYNAWALKHRLATISV